MDDYEQAYHEVEVDLKLRLEWVSKRGLYEGVDDDVYEDQDDHEYDFYGDGLGGWGGLHSISVFKFLYYNR